MDGQLGGCRCERINENRRYNPKSTSLEGERMNYCIESDCGKPKRSSVGKRCASCSSKHGAALRRERRGLPPLKDKQPVFSVKVIDPHTGEWGCWISYCRVNYSASAVAKRTYWKDAAEIREFFYTEHIRYLSKYRFGLFKNNKLIESLN